MDDSSLLSRVQDGVAVLTFNRPERLNAWTYEMEASYFRALEDATADDAVRAIIVTGSGRGFCAGADMDLLGATAESQQTNLTDPHRFGTPLRVPKPIIAAINGPCAGIGLIHALMADVRFVAEDARMTTAFARRGLVAEYNVAWLLARLVGPARALDLLLSARVFSGAEAVTLGVANHATSPGTTFDRAFAYARDLAENCSPWAMAVMKQQTWRFLDASLEDATSLTVDVMHEGLRMADLREGVASFVEKRPPKFAPLDPSEPNLQAVTP